MSVKKPKAPEPVAPISDMNNETFCKHMSIRHQDSLAGMSELPVRTDEYTLGCYRAFHLRLHETRVDLEHSHGIGKTEQYWQDGK
jgi:hypothetical protein